MENQIRDLEQNSIVGEGITVDEIYKLSEEIIKDCQAKKGKKIAFNKHKEKVNQMAQSLEGNTEESKIVALAALLKNLGKLGEHQESLLRAIKIIQKMQKFKAVVVRWLLQLAALKSSKKEHQQCYEIAVKVFKLCQQMLEKIIQKAHENKEMHSELLFAQKIQEIASEKTKDEIIWLVNERSLAEEMLEQIKKTSDPQLFIPFYPTSEFHIADIMSLQVCPQGWESEERPILKETAIYLSISCFTMATEKYYLQDYSQKYNHLKSLKLALCSFDINCTYVAFLLKILNQHFGKRMASIEEEHSETAERYQMRRLMPKDTKEISMKHLQMADE